MAITGYSKKTIDATTPKNLSDLSVSFPAAGFSEIWIRPETNAIRMLPSDIGTVSATNGAPIAVGEWFILTTHFSTFKIISQSGNADVNIMFCDKKD